MKYLPLLLLLLMPVLHAQTTFPNDTAMRAAVLPLTDSNAQAAITTCTPYVTGNTVHPAVTPANRLNNCAVGIVAAATAQTSGYQAAHDYAAGKLDYTDAAHFSALLNQWSQAVSEQTSRIGQGYGTDPASLRDKQHDTICLNAYKARANAETQAQLVAYVLNSDGTGLTATVPVDQADVLLLADPMIFNPSALIVIPSNATPTDLAAATAAGNAQAAAYFNRLIGMLPNNASNATTIGYLKDQAAKYQ